MVEKEGEKRRFHEVLFLIKNPEAKKIEARLLAVLFDEDG
jgi:hypothetical protein